MNYNFIKVSNENHVFRLTLARPEKRNAFTLTMVNEMYHALQVAEADPDVRVVVIDAEGPVFCSGVDLRSFQNKSLDTPNPNITNLNISLGEVFASLNKPSIAVIQGDVVAGAFLIILETTYIFAVREAHFSLPEVKLGLFPFQVLNSLIKVMPEKRALQLCLSGERMSAYEAISAGIVTDYYDKDKVEKLILNLIENAPLAVTRGIAALKKLPKIANSERYVYLLNELNKLRNSEDAHEGIEAIFEKRKPVWKNA